jgi:hypothetical protein
VEKILNAGLTVPFPRVDNRARLVFNTQNRRALQSADADSFSGANVTMG